MDSQSQDSRKIAYCIFSTKMVVKGDTLYANDYGLGAFRIPILRLSYVVL